MIETWCADGDLHMMREHRNVHCLSPEVGGGREKRVTVVKGRVSTMVKVLTPNKVGGQAGGGQRQACDRRWPVRSGSEREESGGKPGKGKERAQWIKYLEAALRLTCVNVASYDSDSVTKEGVAGQSNLPQKGIGICDGTRRTLTNFLSQSLSTCVRRRCCSHQNAPTTLTR
jgi:hypothetical protein